MILSNPKPHVYTLFEQLKRNHRVSSTFPLLGRIDEHTAKAKDGSLVRVYEVSGQDYTCMKPEYIKRLNDYRALIFSTTLGRVSLTVHSSKHRTQHEVKTNTDSKRWDAIIAHKWESGFSEIYRTSHHLVVSVAPQSALEKVATVIESAMNRSSESILEDFEKELESKVSEFGIQRLEGEKLSSFFSSLLNGRPTYVKSRLWDNTLLNQTLTFNRKWNYCTYGKHHDTVYASYLSIQAYPEELSEKVLDTVYALNVDINITQSFSPLSEVASKTKIEKETKRAKNDNDELSMKELKALSDEFNAENLSLCKHYFCVETLATSRDELERKTQMVKNTIEKHGLLCFRETTAVEPLFWSRFPTLEYLNKRTRTISNYNAADLVTFSKTGEGFETNAFGPRPVTHFPTLSNNLYSFNFHNKPSTLGNSGNLNPNGHTWCVGDSEDGKTTILAFLIANCLGYDDFKAILFDRLKGLHVFTEFMDGDYLDFANDIPVNPFMNNDTPQNRQFLSKWLKRLCHVSDDDTKQGNEIDDIVRKIFKLPTHKRTLDEIEVHFGNPGMPLYEKMRKWLPGGAYERFFNASRDALSFDKQIVTFDATTILDFPDLLGAMTDYLFHKHMSMISEKGTPHIVCFDEAPRYFQDPTFAKRIVELIKEIRKKQGVVLLASQDVVSVMNLPNEAGKGFLGSVANIMLYPNPSAEAAHYMGFLGLTETEFKWVKETKEPYKVLFKRMKTGESVMLDVNLSRLNQGKQPLLKMFSSDVQSSLKMEELKAKYGDNWKRHYLDFYAEK